MDVALWDITGKAAGVPIYKLLGTQRYEIRVYATYPPRHENPEEYGREARELMEAGFQAYKIHPGVLPHQGRHRDGDPGTKHSWGRSTANARP